MQRLPRVMHGSAGCRSPKLPPGIFRGDDTVLMARYVWALVHGMARLGIDGQLREPVSVEELMGYAFERLRTGIS